jgi:putative aldouronate transport system permease protein
MKEKSNKSKITAVDTPNTGDFSESVINESVPGEGAAAVSIASISAQWTNKFLKTNLYSYISRSWMLYVMLLLPIAFFIIFRYIPMTNIVIAFKDYNIFQGVWSEGSPWVGLKWFQQAFNRGDFWFAMRNTLILNFLDLIVGFPAPIILALVLNELIFKSFKKVTQTIIYLPHFLSWIIVSSIATRLLAPTNGVINIFIVETFGVRPIDFLMESKNWVMTYIIFGVWKEMGW